MVDLLILLASRSPRRAQLLHEAGYRYEQVDPPYEDPPQPEDDADPESLAMDLAQRKALSVDATVATSDGSRYGPVILTADTVVVCPRGRLLGQPIDRDDAKRMIHSMVDRSHRVVTGVALTYASGTPVVRFADTATVRIGKVTTREIDAYVDSGAWRGKAGGYNLFEVQGDWPITVDGDPTTVVGLPMTLLQGHLRRWVDR